MRKHNWQKIATAFKEPRNRGLIFFGFYFIFFVVLIIILSANKNSSNLSSNNKTTPKGEYQWSLLANGNYHYDYTLTYSTNKITITGDKNNNKEYFVILDKGMEVEYFKEDNIYLRKIDNNWNLVSNPIPYSVFFDYEQIDKLIKESTFLSKTEYADGMCEHHYVIATSTLLSLLDNEVVDLMDNNNEINITVDSNNEVYKISLNITPYYQYKEQTTDTLNITLNFSLFNTIEELSGPNYE